MTRNFCDARRVENPSRGLYRNEGDYAAGIFVMTQQRKASFLAAALLGIASLLQAAPWLVLVAHARGQTKGPEETLFVSANRERAAQRLRPLRWDNSLANSAEQHAQRMAQQNTLSHQLPGEEDFKARAIRAGARFSSIAENVAEGPSALGIHSQWMNSPPHRENLLDPDLDSIGIGVAQHNGQFFAVEDFSRAVPDLSLDEQERELGALLKARGLHVMNGTTTEGGIVDEARWTCSLDKGYAGKHQPSYLFRFTTGDLENLPPSLSQQIRSGKYHSAAVGACNPVGRSDFANYRLAVLLYE
jgi:uncharacterized protein YkwD